jgi:glucosylceramidase
MLFNPKVGWKRAENYARDIMGDLNNWVAGWTDWNLLVDIEGGPSWVFIHINL